MKRRNKGQRFKSDKTIVMRQEEKVTVLSREEKCHLF